MHKHFCEIAGHEWQCSDQCECICGMPMERHDHSDCPVMLLPCPKHAAEPEARPSESMSDNNTVEIVDLPQGPAPHCQCGCADADAAEVVGWCFHCTHVYVDYSPAIENDHFAHHCPGAPSQLRETALARSAEHRRTE